MAKVDCSTEITEDFLNNFTVKTEMRRETRSKYNTRSIECVMIKEELPETKETTDLNLENDGKIELDGPTVLDESKENTIASVCTQTDCYLILDEIKDKNKGRHTHLGVSLREEIIRLHKEKVSISEIARRLKITRNTARLWVHRYTNWGHLRPCKAGRTPTAYTDASPRHRAIVAAHLADPMKTTLSTAIAEGVCPQVVRNHLHAAGLSIINHKGNESGARRKRKPIDI